MDALVFPQTVVAFVLKGTALAVLFAACLYQEHDSITTAVESTVLATAAFSALFILCDMAVRFCNLLLLTTNPDTAVDLAMSLRSTFSVDWRYFLFVSCTPCILLTVFVKNRATMEYMRKPHLSTILHSMLAWMLVKIVTEPSLPGAPSVSSMNGLDYGTGMAYSYYYGYLRIILPSTGTTVKGLVEKMENAEDKENIKFATHKLLILIPSSTYIPPDLKDASDGWMEAATNLEEEQRDRAGAKRRVYRNNMYKIYPGGRKQSNAPVYVVAEGATPLLTFYEVQKHSHPETEVYKRYREQIAKAFYTKLKDLLEDDPDCRDVCELIYYNDYNEDRTKVNVAKVILERITAARKNVTSF